MLPILDATCGENAFLTVALTFGAIRTLLAARKVLEEGVNWAPAAGRKTGAATGSWTGTK